MEFEDQTNKAPEPDFINSITEDLIQSETIPGSIEVAALILSTCMHKQLELLFSKAGDQAVFFNRKFTGEPIREFFSKVFRRAQGDAIRIIKYAGSEEKDKYLEAANMMLPLIAKRIRNVINQPSDSDLLNLFFMEVNNALDDYIDKSLNLIPDPDERLIILKYIA